MLSKIIILFFIGNYFNNYFLSIFYSIKNIIEIINADNKNKININVIKIYISNVKPKNLN